MKKNAMHNATTHMSVFCIYKRCFVHIHDFVVLARAHIVKMIGIFIEIYYCKCQWNWAAAITYEPPLAAAALNLCHGLIFFLFFFVTHRTTDITSAITLIEFIASIEINITHFGCKFMVVHTTNYLSFFAYPIEWMKTKPTPATTENLEHSLRCTVVGSSRIQ